MSPKIKIRMLLLPLLSIMSSFMSASYCRKENQQPDSVQDGICSENFQPCMVHQVGSSVYAFFKSPAVYTDARDICACVNDGNLADINSENIQVLSSKLQSTSWVNSWNTDTYGNTCLLMNGPTINAADCCQKANFICQYNSTSMIHQ